jgi:hypothetical protein
MPKSRRFNSYYFTAILGLVFAIIGFSYNAWRLESSEQNNNIRLAAFTVITELAELEQLIYAAHYDQDAINGSPRKGWVKIGLIVDLSFLIDDTVQLEAIALKQVWQDNWQVIDKDRQATDQVVTSIEQVRQSIKIKLISLN